MRFSIILAVRLCSTGIGFEDTLSEMKYRDQTTHDENLIAGNKHRLIRPATLLGFGSTEQSSIDLLIDRMLENPGSRNIN